MTPQHYVIKRERERKEEGEGARERERERERERDRQTDRQAFNEEVKYKNGFYPE
jgi:hypothetical protein